LDVFVYFPASDLNEAFGRTVIEAILVGVPCLLPPRMHHTFGDLAFYCEPPQVVSALRRLRDSFESCSEFVTAARQRAAARYASDAFLARLATVSETLAGRLSDRVASIERQSTESMPEHLQSYARWVGTGQESHRCLAADHL
jgi:glycosyltransferase involved in cell wall biosynthesis